MRQSASNEEAQSQEMETPPRPQVCVRMCARACSLAKKIRDSDNVRQLA